MELGSIFWGGGVQERMVIKCYSKITTFLAELSSDTVQRLKQRAFLRSVWNARDFLSAWTRRQGAMLVALMFTSFLPILIIWKENCPHKMHKSDIFYANPPIHDARFLRLVSDQDLENLSLPEYSKFDVEVD